MSETQFTCRAARETDEAVLRPLVEVAINDLQRPFLRDDQLAASREIMGLDTQLIADGTYFIVEIPDGRAAGCGGWSRRAALYGAGHTPFRDLRLLDPARDAARIRAVYTHPDFARQGVGRRILARCEAAAAAAGFRRAELLATLAGRELFCRCGYEAVELVSERRGGVAIPLIKMSRVLDGIVRAEESGQRSGDAYAVR